MKKKINLDDLMGKNKSNSKKKKSENKKKIINKKEINDVVTNKSEKETKEKIVPQKDTVETKERIIEKTNINSVPIKQKSKSEKNENYEFVNFLLGKEEYGIDSDYVKQIIKYKTPLDVGIKSDLIFGILSTKEGVLPLVDIRKLFNLNTKRSKSGSIIILQYEDFRVGIYVDYLIGIIRFDKEKIKKIPPFLPEYLLKYIKGVGIKDHDKIVILIDNNILFSKEDIEEIKSLPEQYK